MKAIINITLYFFQFLFICRCHYIQKCCDRKKQLALNFDTCINFDEKGIENYEYETDGELDKNGIHLVKAGEKDSHGIWWLPPDIKFISSKNQHSGYKLVEIPFSDLTDIKFSYNTKCPCEPSEREIVPFTDFVFIMENGSLLITGVDDNVKPKTMMYPYSSYCLDRVSLVGTNQRRRRSSHILDHSFAILLCPCLYMPCVRMCCKWKHFLNFTKIPETCEYSANISLKWNLRYKDEMYEEKDKFPEQFGIIQNMPKCEHGEYHLNENSSSDKKFWILPDGNINAEGHYTDVKYKDYCIHYWNVNGTLKTNLRICKTPSEDTPSQFEHILYGSYFAIGAFFLALTLLIYGIVKELRTTVHAYYLMAHIFCMFISTLVMAINEFFWYMFSGNFCIGVAYVIQFSFISATFWLNVMCIDISDTFKGYSASNRFNLPRNGKQKFMWNSIYVWGATLGITVITAIADNTSILDKSLRPEFGVRDCWFSGGVARFIYFYLPVSGAFIYNSYLFLSTARQILKLQKDSRRLFNEESNRHFGNNSIKKDTHRLMLYTKLFGLMGITWIFEILSWAIGGPTYYWYFTDAINSLRGLFIFLIFCCKKKVLCVFLNTFLSIPKKMRSNLSSNTASTKTNSSCTTNKTNSIQLDILSSSNRNTESESNN